MSKFAPSKVKKYNDYATRIDYSNSLINFEEPRLLEVQIKSFNRFLEKELDNLFKLYFPVSHPKNTEYVIEYKGLKFVNPAKSPSIKDAIYKQQTYQKSLYVDLALINLKTGKVDVVEKPKDGISSGIFFSTFPTITPKGTFIVNGVEKNILPQIVRSPGMYSLSFSRAFDLSKLKVGRKKYAYNAFCEILPTRGTLMHFFIDRNDNIVFRFRTTTILAKSAKILPVSILLKGLGFDNDEILKIYGNHDLMRRTIDSDGFGIDVLTNKDLMKFFSSVKNNTLSFSGANTCLYKLCQEYLKNKNSQTIISSIISEWCARYVCMEFGISLKSTSTSSEYESYSEALSAHLFTQRSYELGGAGRYKMNRKFPLTERLLGRIIAQDIVDVNGKVIFSRGQLLNKPEIDVLKDAFSNNKLDLNHKFSFTTNKFTKGHNNTLEQIDIYENNFNQNSIVKICAPGKKSDEPILNISDILTIISYTLGLKFEILKYDNIEHIGNKRLRLIHEQLCYKLASGLSAVVKVARDKLMSLVAKTADAKNKAKLREKATLKSIIVPRKFLSSVQSFFNTYSLTQFLDQVNPLSELSAKRKITAMGEGGIDQDDPDLTIRDIHYSQFGRICPIESPEGLSVGLIMSLAAYTKIDDNGFLISPYYKIINGVITNEVEWLTALKEDEHCVTDFLIPHDEKGKITVKEYYSRFRGEEKLVDIAEIDYVNISPKQVLSISTGLIPFIESDEGHRAEMGSNMQRQAVPLLIPHAPSVGTGEEYRIAHDSLVGVIAADDGTVEYVDASKIIINGVVYNLDTFIKTNQNTCNCHTPIVCVGDKITANQLIADGGAMNNGELALGQNILIAFLSWYGYNFEDAIVVSERLIKDDIYTSFSIREIHIDIKRLEKFGDEKISRELPGVSRDNLRYLDEDGVILLGSTVREGDVLVGIVRPKPQKEDNTAEENFLVALFGSKNAIKYKNASRVVGVGEDGIVGDIKRFSLANGDLLDDDVLERIVITIVQKRKLQIGDKLSGRHGNKGVVSIVVPVEDMPHLEDGTPIDICLNPLGVPARLNIGQILETHLGYANRLQVINALIDLVFAKNVKGISALYGISSAKAKILVNVANNYFADQEWSDATAAHKKMALIDLTIIAKKSGILIDDLNIKCQTPVFNGATGDDIAKALSDAGIDVEKNNGTVNLIDGRTGEYFDRPVNIGIMYLLKLNHMVDDKIHARCTGPYSRTNQQPLGGKSNNGGQRCGEMELWAFEAHGAAHNIQEIMTYKSDDVLGRRRLYKSIIDNKNNFPAPGLPDIFKLMSKYFQGLCLNLTVEKEDGTVIDFDKYSSTTDKSPLSVNEQQVSATDSSRYNEEEGTK